MSTNEVPGLIILGRLAQPAGSDRGIAVGSGVFDLIGGVIWSKVAAVGCVGDRRSPWRA